MTIRIQPKLLLDTARRGDKWMVRCILSTIILDAGGRYDWIRDLSKQDAYALIELAGSADDENIKIDAWGRGSIGNQSPAYKAIRRSRALQELVSECDSCGIELDQEKITDGYVVFQLLKHYRILPENWR